MRRGVRSFHMLASLGASVTFNSLARSPGLPSVAVQKLKLEQVTSDINGVVISCLINVVPVLTGNFAVSAARLASRPKLISLSCSVYLRCESTLFDLLSGSTKCLISQWHALFKKLLLFSRAVSVDVAHRQHYIV